MPEMYMDVDVALAEVPVNIMPLVDDTDFKTREVAIAYNQAGMDLVWNFTTTAGAMSQTAVTPTTAGDYDWTHQGDGMYTIEIPNSGGASINNDAEGFGWFSGICTGVLPWRSPVIGFRAAGLNNVLIDSAYSTTRGLSGTAVPDAAADAAGGIPISDAGGLDMDGIESKLDNLSSGTAATNKVASSATITTGTETNTYTSTTKKDGVVHSVAPVGGTTDFYYVFELGANGVPVSVQWEGYVNSQGDDYTLYAWNFGDSAWDEVEIISGSSGSTIIPLTSDLTVAHVGTGTEAGEVRFRIYSTDGTNVSTDRVLCSFATIYQSVGYVDGAIWIDTNGSNTGTIDFIDGVADNPVSTVSAAVTLAISLGLSSFHVANGSDIVFTSTLDSFIAFGENWNLDFNGQLFEGISIRGANITGIGTSATDPSVFYNCYFGATTMPPGKFINCGIGEDSGTFTGGSDGEYVFIDCFSLVPGSGSPAFNFSGLGAATGINNRGWKGGANYTLDSACTLSHEVLAGGGQTFTTGGADVELRGIFREATFVLSGAGTVQIVGVTGDITLSGTATSTVNIFGVSAALNDTSVNTTVTDDSVSSTDVGSILVDTAEIGTAGAGLTNISLPNQTMNITGNLSGSVGSLTGHTNQTADHTAGIADIPTVAEFNARTLASADYVVVTDTLARVTLVDTTSVNSDLVSASSIKTAMEASGSDLDIMVKAIVNKIVITEANGNSEMFGDGGSTLGSITSAFSSDGTYTTRKRMVV